MSIVKEKYNAGKVNMLHQLLCNDKEAGKPREYDIKVDELKVVQRTSDPEQFLNHEEFVCDSTNSISITIYEGTSKRCTRYVFVLNEKLSDREEELSGIDTRIQEKINQEKSKWNYEQLVKENEELKGKLNEGEEYVEKMQKQIEDLLNEKNSSKSKMTNTLINLAGLYISSKPKALNGIPFLGELLNANDTVNQITEKSENPPETEEGSASFSRSTEPEPKAYTGKTTSEDMQDLKNALTPYFKPQYLEKMMNINRLLSLFDVFIDETIEVIEDAVDRKMQTKKTA